MNESKDKRLEELLKRLPRSKPAESVDLSEEVLDLLSADEILVTTEGTAGTYILLPAEHSLDLFQWLNRKRIECSFARDAIWMEERLTDSVIELGTKRPREIESTIDEWFTTLKLGSGKWKAPGDSADPEKIGWKYNADSYRLRIAAYRKRPENRFLRPG